jgi:hypothetical protein
MHCNAYTSIEARVEACAIIGGNTGRGGGDGGEGGKGIGHENLAVVSTDLTEVNDETRARIINHRRGSRGNGAAR